MNKEYTPRKKATLNMVQFRHDYNKVKALTKTTHERYILEIFRGMVIENTIKAELVSKVNAKNGYIYTDMFDIKNQSENDFRASSQAIQEIFRSKDGESHE